MTTFHSLHYFLMLAAVMLLTVACGQNSEQSPATIVATPTPDVSSNSLQAGDQSASAGMQTATKQLGTQPHDPNSKLKDWTTRQHTAADKAIEEAYGVFAKDLDECISELGEPDGGPFKDDLARYETAITQSPYLECIQRKLTQN